MSAKQSNKKHVPLGLMQYFLPQIAEPSRVVTAHTEFCHENNGTYSLNLIAGNLLLNYKAKVEALKTETAHTEVSPHASHSVILLIDALSILQALRSNRDIIHNGLSAALASLCRSHAVTLQWIPSRCNMPGNE